MKLLLHQSHQISIRAKAFWNDTGIDVGDNEAYGFKATGEWKDLTISCDADGYTRWFMKLSEGCRRSKHNKWFALMGSLDKVNDFLIGKSKEISFDSNGRLFCYANDVRGFYWNNFGELTLTVTRLK